MATSGSQTLALSDVGLEDKTKWKRNWAPRTKTGCNICRTRRIKCDEEKPFCKRCRISGLTCVGLNYGKSATIKVLDPVDWELSEHARYFIQVLAPSMGQVFRKVGDSVQTSSYGKDTYILRALSSEDSRQRMVLTVLRLGIVKMSWEAGALPIWGTLPGINHVWKKLFRQLTMVIRTLGEAVANKSEPETVVESIVALIACELFLFIPTWKSHAYGFAAYVKQCGGLKRLSGTKTVLNALGQGVRLITLSNTSSSARHQLTAIDDWTYDDIQTAFAHTGHPQHPCPTVLFHEMMAITRLRVATVNKYKADSLLPEARRIAHSIAAFDPDDWQEEYDCAGELYSAVGRVFQTAMDLYGILSLPPSLAIAFLAADEAQEPGETLLTSCRRRHRTQLVERFAGAESVVPRKRALCWAIAPLGIAAHDGPKEREFVRAYLAQILAQRPSHGGSTMLQRALEEFWASGGTTWDDCFYHSISIY